MKKLCPMTLLGLVLGAHLATPGAAAADDYGNTCNSATPVAINSSAPGAIEYFGDSDYFRIDVLVRGTLTVSTTGSTDTFGTLGDSRCVAIVSQDDQSSLNPNFRISRVLNPGRYYLKIRHYNANRTGSYRLEVRFVGSGPFPANDDHGNFCANATRVSFGTPIAGRIERPGDVDVFRFDGVGGCPQCFPPTFDEYFTSGDTDTYGTIYDASCREIDSDDDSGPNNNFSLTLSGPNPVINDETIYIAVRHFGPSGTGSYVLNSREGELF